MPGVVASPGPAVNQQLLQQQHLQQQIRQQQLQQQHQLMQRRQQVSPGFLQAQMMRQRQAAAAQAAANWAMREQPHRLGSAILRLLSYSEQLNSFPEPSSLERWKQFVDDFYLDPALVTHALPCDSGMAYELPTPLLPAYFHTLHQEVSKLNLTFHDAREYYLAPSSHVIECPSATICQYFPNATKVETFGRLRIVFTPTTNNILKIESYEFVGEVYDEWVRRRKKEVSIKMEDEELFGRSPSVDIDLNERKRFVNEKGVTTRHLRFLEMSDCLGQLSPLFGKNPREALGKILQSIPKSQEKTMQEEAAQVLEKQADQTLSQALPPADLSFDTKSSPPSEKRSPEEELEEEVDRSKRRKS